MNKIIIFVILMWSLSADAQITVTHFNADWNDANKVTWVKKLTDCDIAFVIL
jgi:hypothetical protein